MKYMLGVMGMLLLTVTSAAAYELEVTTVDEPYAIVPLSAHPEKPQGYLGQLDGFPVMYETSSTEPFMLEARIEQLYQPSAPPRNLSLLVVRQNDNGGGVTEIARLSPTEESWAVREDAALGLTFWQSDTLRASVDPGTYRIEVSTPSNRGRYQLLVGPNETSLGYFETLARARTTQDFFGYSFMRLLASSYVYYPIGILFLIVLIERTWRYRKQIKDVA